MIAGVILIILGVPETDVDLNVHTLLSDEIMFAPRAFGYVIFLILGILFFICYLDPRYGQTNILVWLMLCSVISSITVMACRGFSSLVTQVSEDCFAAAGSFCVHGAIHAPCSQTLGHWLFWVSFVVIIVTAIWSAFYLNKALQVWHPP